MKWTGLIVKDSKDGTFIAYLKEFPGVVIQGNNVDDIKKKMPLAIASFVDYFAKLVDRGDAIEYIEEEILEC